MSIRIAREKDKSKEKEQLQNTVASINSAKSEVASLNNEVVLRITELSGVNKKLLDGKAALATLKTETRKAQAEYEDTLKFKEKTQEEFNQRLRAREGEFKGLDERKGHLLREYLIEETRINGLKAKANAELQMINNAIEIEKGVVAKLRGEQEDAAKRTLDIFAEIKESESKLLKLKADLPLIEADYQEAVKSLENKKEGILRADGLISEQKFELSKITSEISEANEKLISIKAEIEALNNEKNDAQSRIVELVRREEKFSVLKDRVIELYKKAGVDVSKQLEN